METDASTQAVDELGSILVDLEVKPNNVPLLQRQIVLLQSLSMTAEVLDCISRLSGLVMIGQGESVTELANIRHVVELL
jgi:hypothetical protein